jgi:Immunity protein 53
MITMPNVDLLKQLQEWYASRCDGDWEHTYGISISTLDNPGWSLKVDLVDTYLFDRRFDEVQVEGTDKNDWYVCKVENHVFEAAAGPIGFAM